MKITISTPVGLNEIGGRSNNEDSTYPRKGTATPNDRLFLVCDGVGGSNKGEVASRLVSKNLDHFFRNTPPIPFANQQYLDKALSWVEESVLSSYVVEHPECRGMSTTLTLLHLGTHGATLAWVGDSRIYHIRGSQIQYVTEDHSLVNELLKQGQITAKEAENHPQKNIIMRAISGAEAPTSIDFHTLTDIQAGDFFFLCTDGILETFNDAQLSHLLSSGKPAEEIIQDIDTACRSKSQDNYSCYLIEVEKVTGKPLDTGLRQNTSPFLTGETQTAAFSSPPANPRKRWAFIGLSGFMGFVLGALLTLFYFSVSNQNKAGLVYEEKMLEIIMNKAYEEFQARSGTLEKDPEKLKEALANKKQELKELDEGLTVEGQARFMKLFNLKFKVYLNTDKEQVDTPDNERKVNSSPLEPTDSPQNENAPVEENEERESENKDAAPEKPKGPEPQPVKKEEEAVSI